VLDMPLISVLEVFELVSIATLAACTVWLIVRSMPATLEARQKRIEGISAELASKVAEVEADRTLWKLQSERLATEVETYLGQIERKRASTAASASRMAPAGNAKPVSIDKMSRADQIAMARQRAG